ncbi:MAG TPA: TonB-dependent receptor [Nevskiaceae bacterium]|nr:TonB-dependent receptor [Nevskiaceae bacterium]
MIESRIWGAAMVLALVATNAVAQEAAPAEPVPVDTVAADAPAPVPAAEAPAESTATANRLVEEIVVTAQKREERLQDVPISIQAFSEAKLDVLGIQSVQDVQRATPGFTVTNSAGFNITFLRGVGSDAFLPGVDSSVPFYLDGVPLLAIQGTADTLGRIERVEVLKGPQGTLFGRNATGGTISIVTPTPKNEFFGDVKMEYGNERTKNVVGFVNVPVMDGLAFNVSGFNNQRDNLITNESTGHMVEVYSRGGRVKGLWSIGDDFSLGASGNYQRTSGNCTLDFQNVRPAPVLQPVLGPGDPEFDRTLTLDGDFGCRNEAWIGSGEARYHADAFDTKLIYAKQRVKALRIDGPFDGVDRPIADAHGAGKFGSKQDVVQTTVELQFLSNDDSGYAEHLEWVAGFFYLESLGGFNPIVFNVAPEVLNLIPGIGPALIDPLNAVLAQANLPPIFGEEALQLANYGLIDSQSYSVYAQPTWHMTETVDLTAGLRYQHEVRELKNSHTSYLLDDGSEVVLPLPQGGQEKLEPEQVSARAALQWRPFGPDNQFYASWARGWKNPTYNTVNVLGNLFGTMVALKAERVDTTEVGFKSRLFDDALQLNAAGFWTKQKDPLSANVSIPSGGIANFTNAQHARIKGFDGDFLAIPMPQWNPGLVLTGGFSYIDAIYDEFTNGRGYDDATGLGFGNGGANLPARDLSGYRIPRVPKWSYQGGFNQRLNLDGNHALELGADAFYSSKIYFLPQNSELSKRDAMTIYNARVTWLYNPWGMEVTAYCNNITDELYVNSAFVTDFGTSLMANEDPRLYGLRVKLSF